MQPLSQETIHLLKLFLDNHCLGCRVIVADTNNNGLNTMGHSPKTNRLAMEDRTMTKKRRISFVATCTALAGLGVLLAPTSAKAQCHRPVYAPVTYVEYAPAVVPARTVYVSQPVYVPRPVYVERPVYVAPRYKSRSFNLSLSFGNNSYRRDSGHHRSFRHHDGRGSRRQYTSSRGHRGYRQSGRRSHSNRRRYRH